MVDVCTLCIGIGGFSVKPRQRGPPKPVVYGPVTADGQPPVLLKELCSPPPDMDASGEGLPSDPTKKKIVRKLKKKGIIEDTYPSYLQVCASQWELQEWCLEYFSPTLSKLYIWLNISSMSASFLIILHFLAAHSLKIILGLCNGLHPTRALHAHLYFSHYPLQDNSRHPQRT